MYWLYRLLWNEDEERLRAAWRLLIVLTLWILLSALLNGTVGIWITAIMKRIWPLFGPLWGRVIGFVLILISTLMVSWFGAHFLDHRPVAELWGRFSRDWWLDFAFGLGLGALLMVLIFFIEWGAGWITIVGTFKASADDIPTVAGLLGALIIFICVGIYEEVIFRGYQIRNLAEGLNFPAIGARGAVLIAWLTTSALFGLWHMFNPNSSAISTAYLTLAGLLLGMGLVYTGNLAIPIGLHITWNFFQGHVFGLPVSGFDYPGVTVIAVEQAGPILWTGGSFGPEAGLVGIGAIGAGVLLTLLWLRRRYGLIELDRSLAQYVPVRAQIHTTKP